MNIARKGIYALILSALSFISGMLVIRIKVPEAFTNAVGSLANSYINTLQSSSVTLDELYDIINSYTGYIGQATNFTYLAFAVGILGVILLVAGIVWIYQNR